MTVRKHFTAEEAKEIGEQLGIDWTEFDVEQFRMGMDVELEHGLVDTFRTLHPDAMDRYTWWMYMRNARERNIGWRIDYFMLSESLMPAVTGADILGEVMGSDHCPITLDLREDKLL